MRGRERERERESERERDWERESLLVCHCSTEMFLNVGVKHCSEMLVFLVRQDANNEDLEKEQSLFA